LSSWAGSRETRPAARQGSDQRRQRGGGLVGHELAALDPVLALHVAVVRGEDDVGAAQLARVAQRGDDRLYGAVHREERLLARVVAARDRRDLRGRARHHRGDEQGRHGRER
jgi:hypothetical protein